MQPLRRLSCPCLSVLACMLLAGCGGAGGGGRGTDGAAPDEVGSPLGAGGGTGPAMGAGGAAGDRGATDTSLAGAGGSTAPSCGQPGTLCCAGNACAGGGCCVTGICLAVGTTCPNAGGGVCSAGACGSCGGLGMPCCGSNPATGICTQAGTTCSNGTCARCGGLGEACCAGNACNTGCCAGGYCLAPGTGACPLGPDGGPLDAPLGGAGGAGGNADAPGGGKGGSVGATGGAGGTSARPGGAGGAGPTGVGGAGPRGGAAGTVPSGTGGIGPQSGTGGTTIPSNGTGGSPPGTGGTTRPPWTAPAGCGDGKVTPPERCDDGNTLPFDGCSSDCQPEPSCSGSGPCTSTCGDGLVAGEECDDGNGADGDGCSAACKVEAGFTCEQPALGDPILVPVVYRDFHSTGGTGDFEAGVTGMTKASPGMVQQKLDTDGKPVYTGLLGTGIHVTSKDTFATWYRNTVNVNHATPAKLRLWPTSNGSYANRWGENGEPWQITKIAYYCGTPATAVLDSTGVPIPCTSAYVTTDCDDLAAEGYTLLRCSAATGTYQGTFLVGTVDGTPLFFPVDGDTFSSPSERTYAKIPPPYEPSGLYPQDVDDNGQPVRHNFSFTSELRYWFKYEADRTYQFDIGGDDDVWLFINRQLVVDLGGIHTPVESSYRLDAAAATALGLVPGNVYEVALFQAERQSTSSTLKIVFGGFNSAPSVCRR